MPFRGTVQRALGSNEAAFRQLTERSAGIFQRRELRVAEFFAAPVASHPNRSTAAGAKCGSLDL
jgi:hypothetical protein